MTLIGKTCYTKVLALTNYTRHLAQHLNKLWTKWHLKET